MHFGKVSLREEVMKCDEALDHVMYCKSCYDKILNHQRSFAGSHTSIKKAEAARLNGLKGGRPKVRKS